MCARRESLDAVGIHQPIQAIQTLRQAAGTVDNVVMKHRQRIAKSGCMGAVQNLLHRTQIDLVSVVVDPALIARSNLARLQPARAGDTWGGPLDG